ncbi:MAG: ABC transporter permease subunit, partial [Eubacterium sp.]|nr:ABC transporter permease subunit [Eubacterium sp.]
ENTLESLLLTPVSKKNLVFAKYLGVLLIGMLLYFTSVPYIVAIGIGSGIALRAVFMTFFGGVLLLLSFVAISIILSIVMKSSKASVLTSILIMIVLTLPALIQGIFNLSAVGTFILKLDPVACCFNMMTKMLTDRASVFTLGNYIFPLVLFALISLGLLYAASGKIALKGEK